MIRIQQEAFDTGAEIAEISKGRTDIGAIVSFTGLVRDFNDGRNITGLVLEHYPGMTERELAKIEAEAHQRWQLQASRIIHRYGNLALGEPIVLVITASPHRQDAFDAANFLMDWLKTKAPFWKSEMTADGRTVWVEERTSDIDAARRWQK
ncbi:MAG: molybdenum cofactor biosynthesis protein MoaE [Sneathiella sp.]|mgnify:FL=1|jgi:molybdopterin synthase catalytic subunit|uniref:molybdenum cofactor biosynthesis protein MoaE n=1 Tax=Sneathiella sp. TaxID=1964365 RepID=UPI000C63AEA8|nr:molybdenum cofactor biosynthesis protein MoaE [Sneathiella sp.]MAL80377.1 molybdenum cofactor biosynthesis protein MoaE [Sneathiella sp.]